MTSLVRPRCRFAVSAHRMWRNVLFQSIDHCSLQSLCCWARCWMLQDIDNMAASYVFYVKVNMCTHQVQSKTARLTFNKSGIFRLTVQHDLNVSVSFMYYPGDSLRQTSADVLSLEQCPIDSWQSCDLSCRTTHFIPVDKQTTTNRRIAHLRAVQNPCNLQLYVVAFILSIMNMLAVTYSILPCS